MKLSEHARALVFALALSFSIQLSAAEDEAAKPGPPRNLTSRPSPRPRRPAEEPTDQVSRAEQAEHYTVKILNLESNLFAPEIERSHGSGFVAALTETEGLIFTNAHVVSRGPLDAQKIVVQFATERGNPEAIEGQVIYRSPLTDFAVVKFDPRKLNRAKSILQVAKLANPKTFDKMVRKGSHVMAFGHPLDTSNVSTFGVVSGFHVDRNRGVFIQTSAAINPGNSGGPLIDMATGMVIGINSAKIVDADNTGYVIPLDTVLYDFTSWQRDHDLAFGRSLLARYSFHSTALLKIEKLDALIKSTVPEFFEYHEGLIMVTQAAKSSGMVPGDLILSVGGDVIGIQGHALDRLVHLAKGSLEIVVIREGKLVKLDVPVVDHKQAELRRLVDFVMLSGLVLVESQPDDAWATVDGETRVRVSQIVPYTPAAESGDVPPGSAIVALQFGGSTYPISRLAQIKQVLKKRVGDEPVRVHFHPPVIARSERGASILHDSQFGTPLVLRELHVALLPIDQIVTPRELSIRDMKKHFDFFGSKPANRDWRTFLKKPGQPCPVELADLGEEIDLHALLN